MVIKITFVSFLAFLCACASTGQVNDNDLQELASWMTGSFSSQAQSKKDKAFYDIRLQMARIWKDRTDGVWLYVEQAVATGLDKPYRQRVYHVTQLDSNAFESAVYELKNPLDYAGEWKKETPLALLTPEGLIPRQGASIFLKKGADGAYAGSTDGKKCKSEHRGASYATSKVRITADSIYSWDQGFNDRDEQVWGAVKGGYLFDKIKN